MCGGKATSPILSFLQRNVIVVCLSYLKISFWTIMTENTELPPPWKSCCSKFINSMVWWGCYMAILPCQQIRIRSGDLYPYHMRLTTIQTNHETFLIQIYSVIYKDENHDMSIIVEGLLFCWDGLTSSWQVINVHHTYAVKRPQVAHGFTGDKNKIK